MSQGHTPRPCIVGAPAKLNLFLEIVARRADGFHELETMMLPVDLYDTLEFEPRQPDGLGIQLTCSDADLPTDERNLVYRAARNWSVDCSIRLTKRIPNQAGMGGGSSDAATTLLSMASLFGPKHLPELANSLGSDVGFFLERSSAWCTGRGEIIEPVEAEGVFDFVVVKPAVGCPTGEVYKRLMVGDSKRTGETVRQAVERGDPEQLAKGIFNRLQEPAFAVEPDVRRVFDQLTNTKPLAVQVTGSGSAVFALARDRADAMRIAQEFRKRTTDSVFVLRSNTT